MTEQKTNRNQYNTSQITGKMYYMVTYNKCIILHPQSQNPNTLGVSKQIFDN